MKATDLHHILSDIPESVRTKYFDLQGFHCNKSQEYEEIHQLVDDLLEITPRTDLSSFYIGYRIEQIGKEFDLLRLGENFDLNIEIKSEIPKKSKKNHNEAPEKIVKQLKRDQYYLEAHKKEIWSFCFVADKNILYQTDGVELYESTFDKLIELIESQIVDFTDLSEIFSPKQYLISPFNTPERFLNDEYFLTAEQEEKKKQILKSENKFFEIQGAPGTGKTLLIYDIAKEYQNRGKNVVIIHSGELNKGQRFLNDNGFQIVTGYHSYTIHSAEVLIIDEAQRFYPSQYRKIKKDNLEKLIICGDDNQILSLKNETDTLISYKRTEKFESIVLKSKIRTNKEVAGFIKGLFNLNEMEKFQNDGNINIRYFTSQDEARNFARFLSKNDYNIIDYDIPYDGKDGEIIKRTALSIENKLTAKQVIGQEFDNIGVILGPGFKYVDNHLRFNFDDDLYFSGQKMLFQAITRARQKITLIIFENEELLEELLNAIDLTV